MVKPTHIIERLLAIAPIPLVLVKEAQRLKCRREGRNDAISVFTSMTGFTVSRQVLARDAFTSVIAMWSDIWALERCWKNSRLLMAGQEIRDITQGQQRGLLRLSFALPVNTWPALMISRGKLFRIYVLGNRDKCEEGKFVNHLGHITQYEPIVVDIHDDSIYLVEIPELVALPVLRDIGQ